MPKIRLEQCTPLENGAWALDPKQERHLTRVLRAYEGAMIEGLSQTGERLSLRLERRPDGMILREIGRIAEEPEIVRIHLLIGLLKSDQFGAVLRAAGELGLCAVWPVVSSRSVPRVEAGDALRKMLRWQAVIDEATKVSGSLVSPRIEPPALFADFDWTRLPEARYAALLSPGAVPLGSVKPPEELVFAVGPEGDWSPAETSVLLENGFVPVGLGRRVLRASTAAIIGCGWFRMMAG